MYLATHLLTYSLIAGRLIALGGVTGVNDALRFTLTRSAATVPSSPFPNSSGVGQGLLWSCSNLSDS